MTLSFDIIPFQICPSNIHKLLPCLKMTKSIRNPDPPVKDSVFDMLRLDGRTIIITGGSGGIGYEVARGLAEAGANVRA